jgi:hypothetical protein
MRFSQILLFLTAEGVLGSPQKVMIPKNLFDFDLNLVLNLIAHEMLHVRQKAPGHVIEEKAKGNFRRITKCFFIRFFLRFLKYPIFIKKISAAKHLNIIKEWAKVLNCRKNMLNRNLK